MTEKRLVGEFELEGGKFTQKDANKWLRKEIFDKMKEKGFDPFMVMAYMDDGEKNPSPKALFWGDDVVSLLSCIAESCNMLAAVYEKADAFAVLDAVKSMLLIRDGCQKTGLPPKLEDMQVIAEQIEHFGDLKHPNEGDKNA